MEYIVLIRIIYVITEITYVDVVEERLLQIVHMEEEHFVVGFHQKFEKQRKKSWHDRQIKRKHFEVGWLVLMYDSKFFKNLQKLRAHRLWPYIVTKITDGGALKLQSLDGIEVQVLVNGIQMNSYHDNCDLEE